MSTNQPQPQPPDPPHTLRPMPTTTEELWAFSTAELVNELHRRHNRSIIILVATVNPDDQNACGSFSVDHSSSTAEAIDDMRYAIKRLRNL